MKTRHVPGPWILTEVKGPYDETSRHVIHAEREETDCCRADPRIAVVDHIEGGEGLANARLIAAAPAMLDALRAAEAWVNLQGGYHGCRDAADCMLRKIRAALALATEE